MAGPVSVAPANTNPVINGPWVARTVPDGIQVDLEPSETVLTSLELGSVNWPSSCRAGSCRTCIGHLHKGQVRYEMPWPGLSPEEKAQGYVLPCVAYPCSDLELQPGYIG